MVNLKQNISVHRDGKRVYFFGDEDAENLLNLLEISSFEEIFSIVKSYASSNSLIIGMDFVDQQSYNVSLFDDQVQPPQRVAKIYINKTSSEVTFMVGEKLESLCSTRRGEFYIGNRKLVMPASGVYK